MLILGVLLLGAVVFQWFTQEVTVRVWGPWRVSFHRDDWPAFFWISMGLECGLSVLLIYWYFA
jgi:hypothetical protein